MPSRGGHHRRQGSDGWRSIMVASRGKSKRGRSTRSARVCKIPMVLGVFPCENRSPTAPGEILLGDGVAEAK